MRKIVFLIIFVLAIPLFFGLFNKKINSQENTSYQPCKVQQLYGLFINSIYESFVNPGSQICKTSKGTNLFPSSNQTDFVSNNYYYGIVNEEGILQIFDDSNYYKNQNNEDHRKYFECQNNGQWIEKSFENKECMMKERINIWQYLLKSKQGELQVKEKDFVDEDIDNIQKTQKEEVDENIERIKEITSVLDAVREGKCGRVGEVCCVITDFENFSLEQYLPNTSNIFTSVFSFLSEHTVFSLWKAVFNILGDIFGIKYTNKTFCYNGYPSDINDITTCRCIGGNEGLARSCLNIDNKEEKKECIKCIEGNNERDKYKSSSLGIWTIFGCFYGDFALLVKDKLLGLFISLGGLISLICIIYSAVQIQISQGSPEKIKKAQELLTSCIMGLMVIIFSVFILKVIGVDILKIPGFGK